MQRELLARGRELQQVWWELNLFTYWDWDDGFGAAFLLYASFVVTLVLVLIFHYVPQFGHSHVMVYIAICSLMGSLSVRLSSLWFPDFL